MADDEVFGLVGGIASAIYDDFCNRATYNFGGEVYELLDSEIGEPFILSRKRDGKQFAVDLEPFVTAIPEGDRG